MKDTIARSGHVSLEEHRQVILLELELLLAAWLPYVQFSDGSLTTRRYLWQGPHSCGSGRPWLQAPAAGAGR